MNLNDMPNLIVTDNFYLEVALKNFLIEKKHGSDLLFVDLDSFHSLCDMLKSIKHIMIDDSVKVCLIGTDSVNYNVLSCFNPISINVNLKDLKSAIYNCKFSTLSEINIFIAGLSESSIFSQREVQCLLTLKMYGDINLSSRVVGLPEKTMYRIVSNAGKKINLTRLLQVRRFLSCNNIGF